ncbi:MAG: putative lipoprotein [uncultured Actinomycetospora sp.]|uniref:Putative lipoprotein n=1 Tax=uncultured Actinomycetospora sp. TaxID=1135996 RepID=A0A6J4JLT8_9PSEU|nr:MAG: putative lipoprotein [uncultured Actinomycetospora sp.]
MRSRLIGGVLAAATAAVLAAGCSDSSNAPAAGAPAPATPASAAPAAAPVSPEHNSADVVFAQGMLPHHIQATAMSSQASSRAASQEVKDLAARIDQAQGPEIEQMNQMLDTWGAPRPQPGSTAMPGMPMGDMPMPGMVGEAQMQQLAGQSGAAFDRMFLQMMIEHHTGAVQMAQTEQAQGLNPQAKELAGAIVADQQREITEMQDLITRV